MDLIRVVPAALLHESRWRVPYPHLYALIEKAGLALIVICILGRTWCTLYIGGRKKRELINKGPYSVVRNPLYFFTTIGAAGIGGGGSFESFLGGFFTGCLGAAVAMGGAGGGILGAKR